MRSLDQIQFGLNFPNRLKILIGIYLRSKIDLNDYQESCAFISTETSNNQDSINKMPFWVFNNYLVHLKKIIEEKNKTNNGGGEDTKEQYSNMMSQSKNMYRSMGNKFNFKPPKI